jgi:lipopolysaccharide/colanic/teichoic acid biosynthesis glycosyltransferase
MSGHSETLRTTAASWRMATKRLEDVVVAAIGIVILAPVFAVIAIAIRLEDGGPVFYRQVRVGRAGRPFEIDKFRSMIPAASSSTNCRNCSTYCRAKCPLSVPDRKRRTSCVTTLDRSAP